MATKKKKKSALDDVNSGVVFPTLLSKEMTDRINTAKSEDIAPLVKRAETTSFYEDFAPIRRTGSTSLLEDEDDSSLIAKGILGHFREHRNERKQEREYEYINNYVNGERAKVGMTYGDGKKITSQTLKNYSIDFATDEDNLRLVTDSITGQKKIVDATSYKTRDGLENMTSEEITKYNTIYKTQGANAATEYLDSMQIELSKRGSDKRLTKQQELMESGGKAGAALWSAMSVPMNVYGGMVNAAGQAVNKATGKEYNPYTEGADILNRANIIRSTVNENLEGKKVAQMAYNAGMSAADNVFNMANAAALGAGKAGMQILNSGVMGASSFGSTVKELKDAGVKDSKITATGLTRAGIEAAMEYIPMDNLLSMTGAKTTIKALVKGGLSQAAAEGSTEGLTELATTLTDRAILKKDSDTYQRKEELMAAGYSEEEAKKQVRKEVFKQIAEAAGTGAIAGGAMGSVANAAATASKYTDNEKKVIDAEVKSRVAEKEANGTKLSKKEKAAVEEQVRNDLEKGYISIDSIESALGGETYNSYKAVSDEMEEYDSLNKMKAMEMTGEQSDRLAELKEKNKQTSYESEKTRLKEQLSKEVSEFTVNDRFLRESYNEKSRRGQTFEADLTKYKSKEQKAIIQKAIDSKILNNTNRTHEFVDMISKISADKGVLFDFTNNEKLKESGFDIDGKTVNGFVQGNNISLNIQSAKSLNKVVGHEITHVLEGTDLYSELQNAVKEYATTKGEYDTRLKALQALYKDVEGANVENELTADLIGDYLFTDEKFVNNLSTKNPNIFKKIYEEIKYLVKVATAGSKEAKELEKVKRIFEKAYRKTSDSKTGNDVVNYSITEPFVDDKGNQYKAAVLLDTNFFNGLSPRNWGKKLKTFVENRSDNNPFIMPVMDESGNVQQLQFANKKDRVTRADGSNHKVLDKLSRSKDNISKLAVIHIDEIVEISEEGSPYHTTENNHQWLDENGWLHRTANVINAKNGNVYELIIDIAKTKDGRTIMYSTSGKINRVGNVQVNSLKIRGSGQNSNSASMIQNNNNSVKKIFSLSEDTQQDSLTVSQSIEHTKDLVAIHNMTSEELSKSLDLGGLPMPSIAIIKAQTGHEEYGDVSLVFGKDTIDPQFIRKNKVYGGDAWTPTYPKIEYKPNEKVAKKISDTYYEIAAKHGYKEARPLYRYVYEIEDVLNRNGGEAGIIEQLQDDTELMQLYRLVNGKEKIADVVKEIVTELSESEIEMNDYFINALGADVVSELLVKMPGEPPMARRKAWYEKYGEQTERAYKQMLLDMFSFTEEEANNATENLKQFDYIKIIRDAAKYLKDGGKTVKTEYDHQATKDKIRSSIDAKEYKQWLSDMFSGIEEKSGIRNNKEIFTYSGNRRSWEALHWENNLENVVKAMSEQENGTGFFGGSGIWGVSAKEYGSIDEIKADSSRLTRMDKEQYEEVKEALGQRLQEITVSIMDTNEPNQFIAIDNAMECIVDAIRSSKTKSGILNSLKQYRRLNVTETTADDIVDLVKDIQAMPTEYFEAKPQRAVELSEIQAVVIPNTTDESIKQRLQDFGLTYYEYDPNVEGDRKRIVNSLEDVKFSLSSQNGDIAPIGKYNVYGRDIALEPSEDIAPVRSDIQQKSIQEDIAPVRKDIKGTDAVSEDTIPKSPKSIKEVNRIKRENYRIEIDRLKNEAEESHSDFNRDIAEKQAEYDGLKNKNTNRARSLRERIDRLKTRRDNTDAHYERRINSLQEKSQKMETKEFQRAEQRMEKQAKYRDAVRELIGDTSGWRDKKMGISYQVNTLKRNLRDIVKTADGKPDIQRADAIYDEIQGKYNHNEALLNTEARRIKAKYKKLKINSAEDAYIQMLGEYKYNPDCQLTSEEMEKFYSRYKDKIDVKKVDSVIEDARKLYDELYSRVNEVLREHGMKEIGYREGYFPHFTEDKQGIFARILNWKVKDNNIPTDIAGLTENFNPERSWQSFNKHRTGDKTDYSFQKGLDTYVNGALDWIYHIEDLQMRRAFENEIRYQHSDQGIKEQIEKILSNEELDADEAQEQIDLVYKTANNPLNNFITDFRNATNNLAGKKSSADRTLEYNTNRKIYSVMTNISNRVSANMVAGSVSSALTNFIPITQSWSQVTPVSSLKAMRETIKSYVIDDGMIEKSDFMTNRLRPNEQLYQTFLDKAGKAAGSLMEFIDNFTTQVVWRSKYMENMKKGMTESDAVKNADHFAEGIIAGRSRGNMPTIFNSKNPVTKLLTAFQLEVSNQYAYMFKDLPQDVGTNSKGKLIAGYASMFLGAYAYNALYSQLTGRNAAFDPVGIIMDLIRDLSDEDKEPLDAVGDFAEDVADEIPFIGGLLGGGRVPISAAFPYDDPISMVKGTVTDAAEGNWKQLTKEWLNPVFYVGMPFGGGQTRKTIQGLKMFDKDLPVSGSYTDSGNLRFPVEDTVPNRIQAAVFGQYANKNARQYFDEGYAPLKEKQIQEYVDAGVSMQEYWDYRQGLSGLKTNAEKVDYIADLDLPIKVQNTFVNNVLDGEKDVDLTNYDKFADFEEFDFSTKNPEKYEFLRENNISYSDYISSEENKEAYNWAYNNPEGYTFSKAIADDVLTYKQYTNDIGEFDAKNEKGETVSGLKKERVWNYIDSLDLEDAQKYILFKSQNYKISNSQCYEIIDYLNSRDDISYSEMKTILEELDFKVDEEGNISW